MNLQVKKKPLRKPSNGWRSRGLKSGCNLANFKLNKYMSNKIDVITYAGTVNTLGYERICQELGKKDSEKAILVLATPGGDPHAGFRIARALQCNYGSFDALIPRYCKSAGTLIVIGASTIYMDDMAELGPLDIQVKKGDELIGRNSGLDIFQAVTYLQVQSMNAFRNYLVELTQDTGLSTRIASDIASRLTSGLFEPIAAQIDPIKLAEMQRATEIAFHYGSRLNEKSENMLADGMRKLVTGYPSHGFVIDRKEARTIFSKVEKPIDFLATLSKHFRESLENFIDSPNPVVNLSTYPLENDNDDTTNDNDNTPNAEDSAGCASANEREVNRDCADIDTSKPDESFQPSESTELEQSNA